MLAAVGAGTSSQVVWVSLAAGIGVTTMFSVALFGGARAAEARRDGQAWPPTAFSPARDRAGVAFLLGVASRRQARSSPR